MVILLLTDWRQRGGRGVSLDFNVLDCIPTTTAEGGCKAGEERTGQQRNEHPQRGPGSNFGGGVSRLLGLEPGVGNGLLSARIDLVDTFLGVRLAQVGPLATNCAR
jgi:hypothetical protein